MGSVVIWSKCSLVYGFCGNGGARWTVAPAPLLLLAISCCWSGLSSLRFPCAGDVVEGAAGKGGRQEEGSGGLQQTHEYSGSPVRGHLSPSWSCQRAVLRCAAVTEKLVGEVWRQAGATANRSARQKSWRRLDEASAARASRSLLSPFNGRPSHPPSPRVDTCDGQGDCWRCFNC